MDNPNLGGVENKTGNWKWSDVGRRRRAQDVADPRRWRSCDPVPPMDSEQYSMSLYGFMPLTSKCNL